MKILHLSIQDVGGGAFDAAYRLHRNMKAAGIDSMMAVLRKNSADDTVIDISRRMTSLERVRHLLARVEVRLQMFRYKPSYYFYPDSRAFLAAERILNALPFVPDAIVVHFAAAFVTPGLVQRLHSLTKAPILWYMMDMALITGGCHYAFGCTRYVERCGDCPQLHRGRGIHDISRRQWRQKQESFDAMDITAVAATEWQMRQASVCSLFKGRRIKKIMIAPDTGVFMPAPKAKARELFGLPPGSKIIFFGANQITEPRKGIAYLLDALDRLYAQLDDNRGLRDRICVVSAGNADCRELPISFEHRHIGFLRGDGQLASAYQAADLFLSSSVEDSGPMMINEAILCGTPVVVFDMGVAPDLVHNGITGYRARLRDAADMATGMRTVLEATPEQANIMGQECRALGMRLCSPEKQVGAFLSLCTELTRNV